MVMNISMNAHTKTEQSNYFILPTITQHSSRFTWSVLLIPQPSGEYKMYLPCPAALTP